MKNLCYKSVYRKTSFDNTQCWYCALHINIDTTSYTLYLFLEVTKEQHNMYYYLYTILCRGEIFHVSQPKID